MSEITFIETDSQAIEAELIEAFEAVTDETFYPGDERRLFLLNEVPVIVGLKNDINYTGNQNLLRNSKGEVLDAWGERTVTPRIAAKKSNVPLLFTLSASQTFNVTIPEGTKVTPDGKLSFETVQEIIIAAGQTSGSVNANATVAGADHNGFTAGQISILVDPVPYVGSVTNTDTSANGADIEEDDDGENTWSGYRERIRGSYSKPSTAGAEETYIYWAKTAHQDIADVKVTSPAENEIVLTVLMKNGEVPTQTILDAVVNICSGKKARPLTDHVSAAAPTTQDYSIAMTYYISKEQSNEEDAIRAAIEESSGAVDQYVNWQKAKLGRDISPDELQRRVMNAGACRLVIIAPEYQALSETVRVNLTGTPSVTYGGLE